MRREPPLPRELRDQIPPPVQAALWLVVEGCERHIAGLEAEVRALKGGAQESTARLGQSPQNSSRPPSSGGPQVKRKPPRAPSGRERGGQPGHPVHQRALLPPERVDEVVVRKPGHCRRCGGALQGSDAAPLRHQVVEVPPPVPYVTEYQLHRLARAGCGITTCGALPPGVPAHSCGPRLASLVGLCGGAYRVSKRMVASFCAEVWGAPLALGEVGQVEQTAAAALDPAVQEARAYVQAQDVDVDGTPWREQQRRGRLWVVVTQWGSVFCIRTSRGAEVLWELLGGEYGGVLTGDRAKAYSGQPLPRRQVRRAHLRRDFQAMVDRGGAGAPVGERRREQAEVLFGWRRRVRDGTWRRAAFRGYVTWLRGVFRAELVRGTRCGGPQTAATCQELLKVEPALWTFARVPGTDVTNNAAERALRHAAQWRKTSCGADSVAGSHFVENVLTVAASCRQQERNLLDYPPTAARRGMRGLRRPPCCRKQRVSQQ